MVPLTEWYHDAGVSRTVRMTLLSGNIRIRVLSEVKEHYLLLLDVQSL